MCPACGAGALATARWLRESAPHDADASGLLALLLVARPVQRSQALQLSQQMELGAEEEQRAQHGTAAMSPADAVEAAQCCTELLAADPSYHAAVVALLSLHDHQPLPGAVLVAGYCYYVEGQPPSWEPPLLELRAWQHLAAALVQAAATVVAQQQRLDDLQQQRQPLLPRSLHEVQQRRRRRGEGGSREQERWQLLQELTVEAVEAQQQLQLAFELHEQCCTVMRGRLWWRDAHLLPQTADTVEAALQAGAGSPAALVALAAVNAFLHPLWQRKIVQDWR